MDDYVTKPISPAALFKAIKGLLPAARQPERPEELPPVEGLA
jgi:DNA-binding response OmpR family regulator